MNTYKCELSFVWMFLSFVGYMLIHIWGAIFQDKTDFPSFCSYHLPKSPWLMSRHRARFLPPCWDLAWHGLVQILCMLSQQLWVHMLIVFKSVAPGMLTLLQWKATHWRTFGQHKLIWMWEALKSWTIFYIVKKYKNLEQGGCYSSEVTCLSIQLA